MPVMMNIDPRVSPLDAVRLASLRGVLPSALSSREQQIAFTEAMREVSVFSARTTNAHYLQTLREVINQVLNGDMDKPLARLVLKATLHSLGYSPEGGFPEDEAGLIPPAVAATLEDLSSNRRIKLMLDTQISLNRGRGQRDRGLSAESMAAFPAWELVRVNSRHVPRIWEDRWEEAGGILYEGRMIAMKGDPFWLELGSSEYFDDALDVGYPPFAFNSGMGWSGVSRAEVERLGIVVKDGAEVYELEEILPDPPQASSVGLDSDFVKKLQKDLKLDVAKNGRMSIADILKRNLERNEENGN